MAKKQKPPYDDSQIQEIDLSAIDLSAIDLDDLTSLEPTKPLPVKKIQEVPQAKPAKESKKHYEEEDVFFPDTKAKTSPQLCPPLPRICHSSSASRVRASSRRQEGSQRDRRLERVAYSGVGGHIGLHCFPSAEEQYREEG